MHPLNVELKNEIKGKGKPWYALAAFAFGCGVFVMAFMSVYYGGRLDTLQAAHGKAIASMEARHTREKNRIRKEVIEPLGRIERQAICTR